MKRTIAIILAIAVLASVAIGATLAYLTDRDEAVNIFTVGNVEIEIDENFDQGALLMPGVTVTKEVKIDNVGTNDAWVWYTYAVPAFGNGADMLEVKPAPENNEDWVELTDVYQIERDGITYNVYTMGFTEVVKAGESTSNCFANVTLNRWIDYNINDGKWYYVHDGKANEISGDLDDARVFVNAYAIQSELDIFENSIHGAYAAFNAQWGSPSADEEVAVVDKEVDLSAAEDARIWYSDNVEADTYAITVTSASATDYIVIGDKVIVAEDMLIASEKPLGVYLYDSEIDVGSGITFDNPNHTVIIADCDITLNEGATLVTGQYTGQIIIGGNVTVNGVLVTYENANDYIVNGGALYCDSSITGAVVAETVAELAQSLG